MAKKRKERSLWWERLAPSEKQAHIERWERTRDATRVDRTGQRVSLPNGLVKIWKSPDSYSIYKPGTPDYERYVVVSLSEKL